MSKDIMADLETCGTRAGCAILSIGACTFDLEHTFYDKISLDSCKAAGLHQDPSTMAWWDKQTPEARTEAFSGTNALLTVLGAFSDWYRKIPEPAKTKFIWGNGADFDLPILEAAFNAVGLKKPWEPWNGRCYRTLKNLYFSLKAEPFIGVKHNALADAKFQALHARKILSIHFADD